MFELILATNNPHKREEYLALFEGYDIKIHLPSELGIKFDPIETGKTYQANSLIKAKAIQKFSKLPILADDSGFEVASLGYKPGLMSARFAKKYKNQKEANEALIQMVGDKDKSARFVCFLTMLNIEEEPLYFVGIADGKILDKQYGHDGFGYDPIFFSNEANKPFGELDTKTKNLYSHRAKATKKMIEYLKENFIL